MCNIGVTAFTCIQQRQFNTDTNRVDIVVNACCPGYVKTSMSDFEGDLTPDEGGFCFFNINLLIFFCEF